MGSMPGSGMAAGGMMLPPQPQLPSQLYMQHTHDQAAAGLAGLQQAVMGSHPVSAVPVMQIGGGIPSPSGMQILPPNPIFQPAGEQ